MSRLSLAFAASLFSTSLSAQQPATPPVPQPTVRASTADTSPFRQLEIAPPNAFRSASGMPGPLYWQQKADYNITVSIDTATHTVRGSETLT